jgi:hypothetical protein
MFRAKKMTTSQDGSPLAGMGRSPSIAAETATKPRKAANQPIACRGP